MSPLKHVVFEQIEVGETFGPIRVVVDDGYVKQHAFALDDYHPWSMGDGGPDGVRIAQSTALLADLLRLLNESFDPHFDRGLHQRELWWVDSPVAVGEEVELRGAVTETYWRRGRPYFVVEAQARAVSDGRSVLRHRAIEAVGIGDPAALGGGSSAEEQSGAPSRRIAGVRPDSAPVAMPLDPATVRPGMLLPPLLKNPRQAQVSVYSNVAAFWHTTHTDLAVAQAEGLDRPIAQGLMEAGYVAELAMSAFGAPWLTGGHGEVAFVAPMFPGDEVEVVGVVSAVESRDGGTWVEIECWVENTADGTRLCVGWVDATL